MKDEFAAHDAHIDEALHSYPLAQLPPGFTDRVMAQVAVTPQVEPQFRLQFIDLALPGFMATFGTAVLLFFLWLSGYWTIEGLPAISPPLALVAYLKTVPPSWFAITVCVLFIEIMAGLMIAARLINDPPLTTLLSGD